MPSYRKARNYVSSLLAKNEVNREDNYNKKIFVRLRQGEYLPNPTMSLWIDDQWVNFYDLIDLDNLYKNYSQDIAMKTYLEQIMYYKAELEKDPNAHVSEQAFFKQLIKNNNK